MIIRLDVRIQGGDGIATYDTTDSGEIPDWSEARVSDGGEGTTSVFSGGSIGRYVHVQLGNLSILDGEIREFWICVFGLCVMADVVARRDISNDCSDSLSLGDGGCDVREVEQSVSCWGVEDDEVGSYTGLADCVKADRVLEELTVPVHGA